MRRVHLFIATFTKARNRLVYALLGFVFFSMIACQPVRAAIFSSALDDSIRVDGRVILVEAQVQFDSLLVPPKAKSMRDASRLREPRRPLEGSSFELGVTPFIGLGAGPLELRSWIDWSGRYDWSQTLSLQHRLAKMGGATLSQKGWERSSHVRLSFSAQQFAHLNREMLPDSVIGFIPEANGQEWSAVTFSRYSNGVETDTIALTGSRQKSLQFAFEFGLAAEHRKGWEIRWRAGATVNLRTIERLQLFEPKLDGTAWRLLTQEAFGILPTTSIALGRQLATIQGWQWKVWADCTYRPQSMQNLWFGVGFTVNRER